MTDTEFIAEWNATGCRGCMERSGLTRNQCYYRFMRLRGDGHKLKRWPRTGRPVTRDHEAIALQALDAMYRHVAVENGLTVEQVYHSVRMHFGNRSKVKR